MSDFNPYAFRAWYLTHMYPDQVIRSLLGIRQTENAKASAQTQISYEDYLKAGNQRALDDWQKNVGKYGKTIRYPEFSYPGQIYRSDTAIARNMLDYDTADANFYGRSLYGSVGLYGVGSRLTRWL